MKLKKINILFVFFVFILSCDKDSDEIQDTANNEDPEPTNEVVDLGLVGTKIRPFEIEFNIDIPNSYTNKKILWGANENITTELYTGFQDITENGPTLIAKKLRKETTYYFRLAAFEGNIVHYSEVMPYTTTGIEVLYNDGIPVPGVNGYIVPHRVFETNDGGYIIASEIIPQYGQDTSIIVVKIDSDYNFVWRKIINNGSNSDRVMGLYTLPQGGYMVLARQFSPSSVPPYDQYLSYIVRISEGGDIIWNKYFRYKEGNDEVHFRNDIYEVTNDPEVLKFVIASDSTRNSNQDAFAWEATIDEDGNILSRFDIDYDTYFRLGYLKFDRFGNKFSYTAGGYAGFERFIEKFDNQGNSLWIKNYGPPGTGGPIGEFIFDDEKIVYATADESVFLDKSNWIFKANTTGDIIWEYKVREDTLAYKPPNNPSYKGLSVMENENNEITASYIEGGSLNSFTTFSSDGDLLWKFYDETTEPNFFNAHAAFLRDNSYIIIGVGSKPNPIIWVKKFGLTETIITP